MERDSITVMDVYDIAHDIGKECAKIIDLCGAETLHSLMPRIVSALELLEQFASKNERETSQIHELTARVNQLESDKLEKAEYRDKFEKDLELIEDQWRTERKELVALVAHLQDENRRLQQHTSCQTSSTPRNDIDIVTVLQTTVDKQRDDVRQKTEQLQQSHNESDNLKVQMARLHQIIRDMRRKQRQYQSQIRVLCEERADYYMGHAHKSTDVVKSDISRLTFENDVDDDNRPRFTTNELKSLLQERNELKTKLNDAIDELETYRPRSPPSITCPISPPEDAPVQGPIPYEPDDAPWKRALHPPESGIRKFFRRFFTDSTWTVECDAHAS